MIRNDILKWVENPARDYYDGLELLKRSGALPKVVRMYESRSPRFAMDELVYLLSKKAASLPSESEASDKAKAESSRNSSDQQSVSQSDYYSTPSGIAKRLVQDLFKEISILHNQLYDVGTANDPRSCQARVGIMQERDQLVVRYNELYEAKEKFFSGEIDEQQLLDIINYKDKAAAPQPVESSTLSDVALIKKIKAVKACITRANNMMQYQSEVAVSNGQQLPVNPMPKCPKREKLEQKVAAKLQELVALQCEAQNRGLNGTA